MFCLASPTGVDESNYVFRLRYVGAREESANGFIFRVVALSMYLPGATRLPGCMKDAPSRRETSDIEYTALLVYREVSREGNRRMWSTHKKIKSACVAQSPLIASSIS